MSDLVGNPEDGFSQKEALLYHSSLVYLDQTLQNRHDQGLYRGLMQVWSDILV